MDGKREGRKKLLDQDSVNQLCEMISDRFTAEELVEILGLTTEDVFNRYIEECLRVDWSEHL